MGRIGGFSDACFAVRRLEWKRDLCIAHIQRIQKRFLVNQRCVIDVERDFAHECERIFLLFVIVNPHALRHQTAKGIEREMGDPRFDAVLVQFIDDQLARLAPETFGRQIPAAAGDRSNREHDRETNRADQKAAANRRLSILRGFRRIGLCERCLHYFFVIPSEVEESLLT